MVRVRVMQGAGLVEAAGLRLVQESHQVAVVVYPTNRMLRVSESRLDFHWLRFGRFVIIADVSVGWLVGWLVIRLCIRCDVCGIVRQTLSKCTEGEKSELSKSDSLKQASK